MADFTSILLVVAIILGSALGRYKTVQSYAEIQYTDGHIEYVQVNQAGDYFCPRYCLINHRHKVHDIRWVCEDGSDCAHFRVYHVKGPRPGRSLPAHPPRLADRSQEDGILANVDVEEKP